MMATVKLQSDDFNLTSRKPWFSSFRPSFTTYIRVLTRLTRLMPLVEQELLSLP